MASDESEQDIAPGDEHERLLALLNGYGVSESVQRLLALQLAGGCTRTENGREIRGEIDLAVVVDPVVDQTGLFKLLSELAPASATVDGTDASYGGLFASTASRELERGLLKNEYDWYFVHRADALKKRVLQRLEGILESGTPLYNQSRNPRADQKPREPSVCGRAQIRRVRSVRTHEQTAHSVE